MKRLTAALVAGIIVGYGIQCGDDAVAPPALSITIEGSRVVAMSGDGLVLDSTGRVWAFGSSCGGGWCDRPHLRIPVPADSVAVWQGDSYGFVELDGTAWVWDRQQQAWVALSSPLPQ